MQWLTLSMSFPGVEMRIQETAGRTQKSSFIYIMYSIYFWCFLWRRFLNVLFIIESESLSVVSYSLRPHGLYSPWNSPGQNTGVGSLSLLQGIFPTQGLNPGLLHCRRILYHQATREAQMSVELLPHSGQIRKVCGYCQNSLERGKTSSGCKNH